MQKNTMIFRAFISAVAGLAMAGSAVAAESCAMQAARLLTEHRFAALAGMFAESDERLVPALAQMAAELGPVESLTPLSRQTPVASVRHALALASLPSAYAFAGSWAAISTSSGQGYEVQAASRPGSDCRLLALHLSQLAR